MAQKSKAEREADVHDLAMRRFHEIWSAQRDEREQCTEDRRFCSIAGAQWEGPFVDLFDGKPRLEVNKIHLAVIRIFNEYRNNRISATFFSKDGSDQDDLADTCAKLHRADEQDSVAEEAYDNAFEEAVTGGFGAWRLRADYEDEDDDENEQQRILIEPIFDADTSVFFDLNAKRQDKSDAHHCFVLTSMTRAAYEEEYGDEAPASMPRVSYTRTFDWLTPDVVTVAEYYVVEKKKDIVHIYQGADGSEKQVRESELEEEPEMEQQLSVLGYREMRQKKIHVRKVRKYIINGAKVIEDCGHIAGKCIPVVPVYGKRWFIDNVERCMGHVRLPKDPQRLKNMQVTKLAELSALSSVEKPIFTPEQIAGHQVMWAEDNIKNFPYLVINAIRDLNGNPTVVGPQQYTKPPQIPPAMAALLQITEQDIQDLLGNPQAGEKIVSNISNEAIERVQNSLGMQTFIYVSNMAKAIKRSAQIWLEMAKEVLIEEGREMRGVGEQGENEQITLNRKVILEDGQSGYENNLDEAKFDVAVDVGPSSSSRKQSTVKALTELLGITQDPESQQVLSAMIMLNSEGEGVGDVRKFYRKRLLRMGVLEPTKEEQDELTAEAQNQPPDPNAEFLLASAEKERALTRKTMADTLLAIAKTLEAGASATEKLEGIDQTDTKMAIDTLSKTLGTGQPSVNGGA